MVSHLEETGAIKSRKEAMEEFEEAMEEMELRKKFIRGCESIGGEPTKLAEDRFKCEVKRHKVIFDTKLNEATLSDGREVISNLKPVEDIEINKSFLPKKPLERVGELEESPSILRMESDDDWFSLRETRFELPKAGELGIEVK